MMFEQVTCSLKRTGELCDIPLTTIESDDRWITKRKSILTHSFPESPRRGDAMKRKEAPTVGENKNAPKKRLGMLPGRRVGATKKD